VREDHNEIERRKVHNKKTERKKDCDKIERRTLETSESLFVLK